MKIISATKEDINWIIQLEKDPANRPFVWQESYDEHMSQIYTPNQHLFIHLNDEGEK